MKICNTCQHFWKGTCQRPATRSHLVYGRPPINRPCAIERSALYRLVNHYACGPAGLYWTKYIKPKPPTGGSAVEHLGDLYWVKD